MGACGSSLSEEDRKALQHSRQIDSQNHKDHLVEQDKIKLLLLGAGESGKSTVFKQFQILYGQDFSDAQREHYKYCIHDNVHETVHKLCQAAIAWGMDSAIKDRSALELILSKDAGLQNELLTPAEAAAIKYLWNTPAIQSIWQRRAELQVIESTAQFIERLDEIMEFTYMPSRDDILHARVRTTGIRDEKYTIDKNVFELYDVGGQRNERKKWIHCFEGVHAVIYVTALSEYDQTLFEASGVNRMVESLELFDFICNNRFLLNTSMILFLNKVDLYAAKVKNVNIGSIKPFSDYNTLGYPPNDYDAGITYFKDKFIGMCANPNKEIYWHVTCATDTAQVQVIFNACREIIIRENLERNGFVV